ncbi:MAG TPA: ABC transporter permease [Thermoanaerobaculia bacterium]|nr:ABC transporter permease [Thermoanaerobaculia bacterium]
MEALLRELRFASRNLYKNRGFTLAALLCLALGMGASSAIFSVVNAVLLEPLPFAEPDRVVMIWNQFLLLDTPKAPFSGREFFDLESQSTAFERIAVVGQQFVSLTGDGEPQELLAARATAGIFPVLGVNAALGRVFTPDEDVFGKNDVAVLSHELWTERFGSDPHIAGRKITIDGRPFLVTGVLPEGFRFGNGQFDLWVPQGLSPERLMPRQVRTVTLAGRLKPGVSLETAQAEVDVIAQRFQRDDPEAYPAESGYGIRLIPAHEDLVGGVRTALLVLFGAVGLVLVISTLNVANLLLARATARAKEVAIRTALGSSRGLLVRQFLIEGLLLSFLGAVLGLLLAFWATRVLVAVDPGNIPRLDQVRLDGGVLLFTLGLVVATGVLFGLVPVFHSTRRSLRDPLQDGGKTSAGTAGHRTRSALVVVEIGLAVIVLIGAGLMIKSFRRLLEVDPGFQTRGLLTARFSLSRSRYPEDSGLIPLQRQLLMNVLDLPGVKSAAIASELPMGTGLGFSGDMVLEGRPTGPNEPPPVTGWRMVSPGYFETMKIPLLQGRTFTPADDEKAPGAVIVEEDLARRLWPDESPLGKRLKLNARTPEQSVWRTVVGVVGHVRQQGLAEAGGDQLYVPIAQYPARLATLVVAPTASPESVAAGVREAVWAIDRDLPVEIRTIEEMIAGSLTRQRFNTFLFTAFGVIALALTVIGVYGVMAYTVAQRTRDVGIRMALGAHRRDVLRLVVGQGALLVSLGLALGLAAAWGLSRLIAALLYGIEATDAATFAAVSLLLLGMGLAASYVPARRAAKVDPLVALRNE